MPANNGFLVNNACYSGTDYVRMVCSSVYPTFSYGQLQVAPNSSTADKLLCRVGTTTYTVNTYNPDCLLIDQPDIPTTADGLLLGWKIGAVLIFAAAVLFIRKALIK